MSTCSYYLGIYTRDLAYSGPVLCGAYTMSCWQLRQYAHNGPSNEMERNHTRISFCVIGDCNIVGGMRNTCMSDGTHAVKDVKRCLSMALLSNGTCGNGCPLSVY